MNKPEEIDCEGTDEIVCPYCGHEFSDSWEYGRSHHSSFEVECEECNKPFEVYRNYTVDYTSHKIEEKQ